MTPRRRSSSPARLPALVPPPESIGNAADSVAAAVGDAGLAGLVNNAGIVIAGPLELLPLAQFRNQLEVNVVGLVAVTQAFLPLLRVARGRIVNMGSLNGSLAPPYLGAYAASKFALEALSDALRIELRNWRIRVSIIEPGPVNTPIWEKALATADRMAGEVSADALRPYDADLAAMRRATLQAAETAAPVKKVTRAVCHALTARRPKTRYFIPLHTYFLFNQFRLVPACIRDWFVRRAIGLS
jgi:NAD(P)-dependent dehydrogenase (short-subunit alcohol dehydrogenase family)